MSESDRHVLMRTALRAKHLRFLQEQETGRATTEKAERIACAPTTNARPAVQVTNFARLPETPEVLRERPKISHDEDLGGRGRSVQWEQPIAKFPKVSTPERLPKEVANLLDLRRLFDSGKLTREEYLERLNWS